MSTSNCSNTLVRYFRYFAYIFIAGLLIGQQAQAVVLPPGTTVNTLTILRIGNLIAPISTPFDPPGAPYFADFNGDGRQDLLVQAADGTGKSYLFLADVNGKYTSIAQSWDNNYLKLYWNAGSSILHVADLNGDGRADIILEAKAAGGRNALIYSAVTGNPISYVYQTWDNPVSTTLLPDPAVTPLPATAVGATSGAFDVTPSGAAVYTIPFAVPPGINGLEPDLALAYNSQGGNGIAGMGWNLSGLSFIHRCGRSIAQDGAVGGIDFSTNDRFCLSGQRLVRIGTVDGGTEYRTEIESYSRVVAYGGRAGDPNYFKVWNKDGSVTQFGATPDSRVEAQGRSDSAATLWAVNSISDLKGNSITFNYYENSTVGEFHIDRISYGGNRSVCFAYESRPDTFYGYESGSRNAITQRLKTVRTYITEAGSDELIRDYRLYYDVSPATSRSRLKYVQECTSFSCLAPTTMTWQEGEDGFSPASSSAHSGGASNNVIGDFDGDGRADMAGYTGDSGKWHICRANGAGVGFGCSYWTAHWGGVSNNAVGDFNGDGRTDMAGYTGSGGSWHVCLSNGSGFDCSHQLAHSRGTSNNVIGDFNGDGKTDMAGYTGANGNWHVCLSTGVGFDCSYRTAHEGGTSNNATGDFNGDGRTDIAGYTGANGSWHVCLSTSSGFDCSYRTAHSGGASNNVVGDFNGDGKTDMAGYTGANGSWHVCLSTGSGFDCSYRTAHYRGARDNVAGDFNGDGRTDLAGYTGSSGAWDICLSTGDGFSCRSWLGHSRGISNNVSADFNGDGKTDLAGYTGSYNNWDISYSTNSFPDFVTGIASGFGSRIVVEHRPLTNIGIYQKYSNGVAGRTVDVRAPMYVVSRYSTSNGIGGTNNVNITYEGLKAHLLGRGLMGFAKITKYDAATNIETITTYSQEDFPYTGLATSVLVKIKNGATSRETLSKFKQVSATVGTDGVYRWPVPYEYEVVDKKYEVDGTAVTTTTTTTTQNRYGSVENVNTSIAGNGMTYTKVTSNTFVYQNSYDPPLANWHKVAQVSSATSTNTVPRQWGDTYSQGVSTRMSSFAYYASGLLQTETIEPGNESLRQFTTYSYDGYGNRTSVTVSGAGLAPRTTTTTYGPDGLFPVKSSNTLGHTEYRAFDARFGTVTSLTGPNGLTTTSYYDEFGRLTGEVRADGTFTSIAHNPCSPTTCVGNESYYVTTHTSGAPSTSVYYDLLGREVRSTSDSFDGRTITKSTVYNAKGEIERISRPYYPGETVYWIYYEYDALGRTTKESIPASSDAAQRVTTTKYAAFKTTVTDARGYSQLRETNAMGQLIRVFDEDPDLTKHTTPATYPIETRYDYDPFGNLRYIKDPKGNTTRTYFDARGRKVAMDDPDMGHWEYEYNAVGELTKQWDAKSGRNTIGSTPINAGAPATVAMEYDTLGRLVKRTEAEGVSQWTYDTAAMGIGKLAGVSGPGGYVRSYAYDALGRPVRVTTTIASDTFSVETGYDTNGRVESISYPETSQGTRLRINNLYTATGYLSQVKNASTDKIYWKGNAKDAAGRFTEEWLGNGLTTTRRYDGQHGYLLGIKTGVGSGGSGIQDLGYRYDATGNLNSRTVGLPDLGKSYTETYAYDTHNRLTSITASGGPANKNYSYDTIGNIVSKSDAAAAYVYGDAAHAHAVTQLKNSVGTVIATYAYDANGNMTGGNGRTTEHTSYNLPWKVVQNGTTVVFEYDPDRQRMRQVTNDEITVSLSPRLDTGIHFEKTQRTAGGVIEYKHYIYGGSGPVATYTVAVTANGTTTTTRYLHKDHLDSIEAVTDENGALKERLSYDAFGKRRLATGADGTVAAPSTRYGYTSHEMFDAVGLIHMNGRVYDPMLGRFIEADPHAGMSLQGLNRYAYAGNNPLTNVDPSGYSWLSKSFRKLLKNDAARIFISVAVGYWTGGLVSNWLTDAALAATHTISTGTLTAIGFASGAAGGFAAGYVGSGGNMDAARRGALSGGMFGAVGGYFGHDSGPFLSGQHIVKVAAHAAAGCAANAATGGNCGQGALSAGFAEFIGPKLPGGFVGGLSSRAAVGGVASALGGGSFADGATTAAYAYLFNHAAHSSLVDEILPADGEAVPSEFVGPLSALQDAALRASAEVGDWGGLKPAWLRGIQVHTAFARNVRGLGYMYDAEVSYYDHVPVTYGTAGSVRADAIYGDIYSPRFALDLKTGSAYISQAEFRRYQDHLPPETPVIELRVR